MLFSISQRGTSEVLQGSSGEQSIIDTGSLASRSAQNPDEAAWQISMVARCLKGDEDAFAQITQRYGNVLLRTAFLLVKDEDVAQDVVQDALFLAWKNMKQLREPAFLRTWLLKIVVNQSMSMKRQWMRKAALLREQITQYDIDSRMREAEFGGGSIEINMDLLHAVNQLPLNQRAIIVLFYYHKMTMPEIATLLGVAENTLRKRLQSALTKIRRVLQASEQTYTTLVPENIHPHMRIREDGQNG